MTRVDLALRPVTNDPTCIGVGFVAADIVEGSGEEFVAAGGSCGNVMSILAWLGWKTFPVARIGPDWATGVIRKDFDALGVRGEFFSEERSIQTPIVTQRFVEDAKGKRVHRFSLACPECGGWLPCYRASTLAQANEVIESSVIPKTLYMDRVSPAALRVGTWAKEKGALIGSSCPRLGMSANSSARSIYATFLNSRMTGSVMCETSGGAEFEDHCRDVRRGRVEASLVWALERSPSIPYAAISRRRRGGRLVQCRHHSSPRDDGGKNCRHASEAAASCRATVWAGVGSCQLRFRRSARRYDGDDTHTTCQTPHYLGGEETRSRGGGGRLCHP